MSILDQCRQLEIERKDTVERIDVAEVALLHLKEREKALQVQLKTMQQEVPLLRPNLRCERAAVRSSYVEQLGRSSALRSTGHATLVETEQRLRMGLQKEASESAATAVAEAAAHLLA